jgi:tRNA(fMet)-specific endonuclease VapC
MYLLDTDYISLIQRGSGDGRIIFQRLISTNSPLATTVITYEEQMRGWLDLIARATKFEAQVRGYQLLHQHTLNYQKVIIAPFDAPAIATYRQLRKTYPRLGKMDLKIAAIGITQEATLLTRNQRDFGQITTMRSEDWLTRSP